MATNPDSADTNAAVDGGEVTVNIRCSNGSKFTVKTTLDSTVGNFKIIVAQSTDVLAEQQRLIYKGRILKDDQTLSSYGLQADHTIHMVRGFAPPASATPAGTVNTGAPNTAPAAARDASPAEGLGAAGLGASLFPGLGLGGLGGTGASGLLGAGIPDLEQMQQQLNQNPNMMRDIMNMPAMQSLMNNPDIMRNLIMNNPQMRDIIDRNPELGHILNDPSILRQTLETARNPELMREMMRNTDRAMSNIESSPEGFNMLRRMYENVQEPLLNATTMGGDAANTQNSNPLAALLGAQGAAGQQRDGSNNPSTTGAESGVPNTNPLPNPWNTTPGGTQTNTAQRTNPSGLSSLPELDSMLGGVPDLSSMSQIMQNPAMSQMMQSVLSNPEFMSQMVNMNPQLRAMTESNPQLRQMMQNPDLLRQLASPDMMQQMMTLQQSLLSATNRPQTNQDPLQTGGAAGNPNNMGLDMLMNMFGGLGAGGLTAPETSNVPPEELYATQLTQLQEMGFFDAQENIRALQATRGNVHAAVERLLGNLGQ